jgi:peroxiredoxin Q/BCP
MLHAGDAIPEFVLLSDTVGEVSSDHLRGQRFVLYFYPKDNTPGCTIEACNFRDSLAAFNSLNVPVFGISPDDVSSHEKFRTKFGLTFPLLADINHHVAEAFGVWVEKSMYGRSYMGIQRSTFIVGPTGIIERVWEKVTPAEHAQEVLAYLSTASAGASQPEPTLLPVVDAVAIVTAKNSTNAKTEVIEVETETKPQTVPMSVPQTGEPKMPARKKIASVKPAAEAAKPVGVIVVDTIVEDPPGPPAEVIQVFEVESAPVAAKKPAVKKPVAKKPAAKKSAARKPAAKKPAAKKSVAKKQAAKKPVAKKSVAKKPAARKPAAKKPAMKKPAAKKTARR